ncbi:MAG: hypothetical protein ACKO34_07620 [Vampirovibrionales bacterium]
MQVTPLLFSNTSIYKHSPVHIKPLIRQGNEPNGDWWDIFGFKAWEEAKKAEKQAIFTKAQAKIDTALVKFLCELGLEANKIIAKARLKKLFALAVTLTTINGIFQSSRIIQAVESMKQRFSKPTIPYPMARLPHRVRYRLQ